MKVRNRVLLSAALIGGALAASLGLTSLSRGSDGPLTSALARAGSAVASLEHRLWERAVGGGRSERMTWFTRGGRDIEALRHPDSILLGAYDGDAPRTLEGVLRLERTLGVSLPLMQLYGAWGDKPEQRFPLTLVNAIWDLGSVPIITWEPWLTDFDNVLHPGLSLRETREHHGLAAVARGDFDFYIDAWAREAAAFGHPLFIRFAHEMNDPYRYPWGPQNNTKEEYIAAWRHVVERFRSVGAHNIVWVWAPHVAYEYWDQYYPGNDVVDWVGTGVLNFGPIARWSQWWSFNDIFGRHYPRLAAFGKPIMIPELGSLAVGGDRPLWYSLALDSLPEHFPAVRGALFFHTSGDRTTTYQAVDWTIVDDAPTAAAVRKALNRWGAGPRVAVAPK